jgi:tetratricopeptide (TPR) repeat protein
VALIGLALVAGAVAWWFSQRGGKALETAPSEVAATTAPAAARFVGSERCASCHRSEYEAWRGSQHAQAMQHASANTVLGDFADAKFSYAGVQSTFFKRDGKFYVRTDGPDGKLSDFEVRYTFGVAPLQQYLVELPGGRLQGLSVAWDSRPKSAGGQRWFHLYPDERVDFRDELHWTKRLQNWNFMCADCHSTDVRKGYDAASGTFDTRYAEMTVGCEACHGPGSAHLAWAQDRSASDPRKGLAVLLDERRGVTWAIDAATGNAARSRERRSDREIEVCAQCHARRAQIAEGYRAGAPFLDHYLPATISPGLYHADGQQRDEVYIWGSFLQSLMHRKGVTCSDCHDPHTQKLRAEGNAVCGGCHAPAKYDAVQHHGHPAGTAGAQCVSCHMPQTTYMVVDPRRDHSMRVPRPDLSVALGVPNACSGCHRDRDAQWAADAIARDHGPQRRGFQTFGKAFHAAEANAAGAADALAGIAGDVGQSPIARASAVDRLGAVGGARLATAIQAAARDAEPLVRLAAAQAAITLPPGQRVAPIAPLLADPLRAIRIEAARVLAGTEASTPSSPHHAAWMRAAGEYEATQRYNADRPESLVALGSFYAALGRADDAQAQFDAALRLDPGFVPAYVDSADVHRAQGREADALRVLQTGIAQAPKNAALRHATGLALVRAGKRDAALAELRLAAELAPEDPRYAYVYAIALDSTGRRKEAIALLERDAKRWSGDRDILMALATLQRDAGRPDAARAAAAALLAAHPEDREAQALARALQ